MKGFVRNKVHVCTSEECQYYKKDQIQLQNIWKSNNVQIGRVPLRKVARAEKIKGDL
jgi:hypothetical protein